MLDTK